MPKQSLIKGISSALLSEIKATATSLRFPGYDQQGGNWGSSLFNIASTFGGWFGSNRNWIAEVGDPSLSSLVMAATGWVGRRLPEARLQVVETDSEDNENPIASHPLIKLLQRPTAPYPYYSGKRLWKHFAFNWIIDGNVYWWLVRNSRGQIVQIWPLLSWLVWPRWTKETSFIDFYEYRPNGMPVYIKPEDIVHFRDGADDLENPRKAMSSLRSILRELVSDNDRANFQAALMKNSGVPPILVTFKEMASGIDGEKIKLLQSDIQRRISGDERGKAMVVSWPMEVSQLAFDPESLDLRQLGFMSEERFCSVVGINKFVLGFSASSDSSIYNNVESARRSATEDYLVPLWDVIAEELTVQLLSQKQFSAQENQTVKFDTSSVQALQESENEKHDRIRKDVASGILKVKDAQMILGWKPDETADYYLRPATMTPVHSEMVRTQMDASLAGMEAAIEVAKNPPEEKPQQEPTAKKSLPSEYSIKALHDYATTQVDIVGFPAQEMLRFSEMIDPDDLHEKGIERESHITIRYGLHAEDAEELKPFVQKFGTVRASLGRTEYFAASDFDVLYLAVESDDLKLLNRAIGEKFENTQTQPDYIPHATLAYLKSGTGKDYMSDGFLLGYQMLFETVSFRDKEGVWTKMPLDMNKSYRNGQATNSEQRELLTI